ncbi:MAG: hypothetical protein IRZ08_22625, partial [Frankia sp.]|nr:hypothetical protein [Frankia sp.]
PAAGRVGHGRGDEAAGAELDGLVSAVAEAVGPPDRAGAPAGSDLAGGAGRAWYRYHRLLRGTLLDALRRDPAEDEPELNLRAALWYAAHRQLTDAARHASRAGDWRYLAALLVRGAVPLIASGDLPELAELVAAFPDRAAALGPECAAIAALARVIAGDGAGTAELVELARSGAPGAGPLRRALLASLDAIELRRADLAGDVDAALVVARRALRARGSVPHGPAGGLPDGQRTLALGVRGRAELWRGRLETAEETLREALTAARRTGLEGTAAGCLGALALGYAVRGRLRQADEAAGEALAAAAAVSGMAAGAGATGAAGAAPVGGAATGGAAGVDRAAGLAADAGAAGSGDAGGDGGAVDLARLAERAATAGVPEALLALAVAAGYRDEHAGAFGWAELAAMAAGNGHANQLPALAKVVRAWLHLGRRRGDDVRAARRALAQIAGSGLPPLLTAIREAAQADLLIAGGNPDAALRVLGRDRSAQRTPPALLARGRALLALGDAAAAAEAVAPLLRADGGGSASVVSACVISAVAAARRGDHAQAGGLLSRALVLAEDEYLLRPFLELGPEVAALTEAHPGLRDTAPVLVEALAEATARREERSQPRPVVRPDAGRQPAGAAGRVAGMAGPARSAPAPSPAAAWPARAGGPGRVTPVGGPVARPGGQPVVAGRPGPPGAAGRTPAVRLPGPAAAPGGRRPVAVSYTHIRAPETEVRVG